MNVTEILLRWYRDHKRDLPWRKTRDPYLIWISEIILQQTRVEQGLGYYVNFIKKYPDIRSLARTSEQEILKMWQGLGYYSRARNMLFTAKKIFTEFDGRFPTEFNEIIKLKGIGQYTASAIASFAFDQPYPVNDGNVKRFIARYYGIDEAVNTSPANKSIDEILSRLIDRDDPGEFNQAIMEFGALQCKPKNPICGICPLSQTCQAFLSDMVDKLPILERNIKQKKRSLNYVVLLSSEDDELSFWIRKRTGKDIWKNMYDFPALESCESYIKQLQTELIKISSVYKHKLTHQVISAWFHIYFSRSPVTIGSQVTDHRSQDYKLITLRQLDQYPFPSLMDKFIQQELIPEIKKMQD